MDIKKWKDNWPFLSHDRDTEATADEELWDRYFIKHLGGFPTSYKLFKTGKIRFYNLPEPLPEIFDISYEPAP
jgi:hypothetical protein